MKNEDVDTNSMLGRVVGWKGKQEDRNEKKSMPGRGKNNTECFQGAVGWKKTSNKDIFFITTWKE